MVNRRRSRSCDASTTPRSRGRPSPYSRGNTDAGAIHRRPRSPSPGMSVTRPEPFSFVDKDLEKVKEKATSSKDDQFDFYKTLRTYKSQEKMVEMW